MKKVKMILPAVAVAIAICGAYASGLTTDTRLVAVNVTADRDGCPIDGTCTDSGSPACAVSGSIELYRRLSSPISCSVQATGTFTPN